MGSGWLGTHLLHEEDEDLPEDLDEVDEEVQRVGNEVLVAAARLCQKISLTNVYSGKARASRCARHCIDFLVFFSQLFIYWYII